MRRVNCATKMLTNLLNNSEMRPILLYMEDNEVTDSTFAFRVSKKDKEWITKEIDSLKELANKRRAKGTRVINKNDLILAALTVGFQAVRKSYAKGKA